MKGINVMEKDTHLLFRQFDTGLTTQPIFALAMLPWIFAANMMFSGMSLWMNAAQVAGDRTWPLDDSFDHQGDAPAEELLVPENDVSTDIAAKRKH